MTAAETTWPGEIEWLRRVIALYPNTARFSQRLRELLENQQGAGI